ncbi:hypothetical protein PR048_003053 [Dryococelus australis]|uniref:Uncharacterized protein n=1 Tax=Dryococelus australis TaxID=614101 RepID=A0ABQ9ILY6_9NEOP|nr:hypothetical protein PR048_003053 [Dryococelus australis]
MKRQGKRENPEKTLRPATSSGTMPTYEHALSYCSYFKGGATVVERIACSPPTKAIRAQSPAGSIRIFACGNRAGRCRWSAGFLGDLPVSPTLSFRRCSILTSITLIGSPDLELRAVQMSSLTRSLNPPLPSTGIFLLRARTMGSRDRREKSGGQVPRATRSPNNGAYREALGNWTARVNIPRHSPTARNTTRTATRARGRQAHLHRLHVRQQYTLLNPALCLHYMNRARWRSGLLMDSHSGGHGFDSQSDHPEFGFHGRILTRPCTSEQLAPFLTTLLPTELGRKLEGRDWGESDCRRHAKWRRMSAVPRPPARFARAPVLRDVPRTRAATPPHTNSRRAHFLTSRPVAVYSPGCPTCTCVSSSQHECKASSEAVPAALPARPVRHFQGSTRLREMTRQQ